MIDLILELRNRVIHFYSVVQNGMQIYFAKCPKIKHQLEILIPRIKEFKSEKLKLASDTWSEFLSKNQHQVSCRARQLPPLRPVTFTLHSALQPLIKNSALLELYSLIKK